MGIVTEHTDEFASAGAGSADEVQLVEALRRGDEAAFETVLLRYHSWMIQLALLYVADSATAEEVVQDTWFAALKGLDRFDGRSSLKTWLFRILTNRAKTRGLRESRSIPFSALVDGADEADSPAVAPDRFVPADRAKWARHWITFPRNWVEIPEERFLARETLELVRQAITRLPATQQQVINLRDVHGWTATEVCSTFGVSEANQRVLLHRARSKVRRALERYLGEE